MFIKSECDAPVIDDHLYDKHDPLAQVDHVVPDKLDDFLLVPNKHVHHQLQADLIEHI
jgi:hypothetical protein